MLRVALTGGMGSGKSFVANYFEVLGIPVFYADSEAKALYSDAGVLQQLASITEGKAVKVKEGRLRLLPEALAAMIFEDPKLRKRIEAIIHPLVRRKFEEFCTRQSAVPYVISEAALYFETGGWKDFDVVVLVTAPLQVRLERLYRQRGIPPEEAEKRIAVQWPDSRKIPFATFLILNDGLHDVESQAQDIHRRLLERTSSS